MFYAKGRFISDFESFVHFLNAERRHYNEYFMREIEYSLFDIYLDALFFDDSDSDNILLSFTIISSR